MKSITISILQTQNILIRYKLFAIWNERFGNAKVTVRKWSKCVNEKMQMNGWFDLNINIHKLMVQKDFIVFRFIYFKVSEVTVL